MYAALITGLLGFVTAVVAAVFTFRFTIIQNRELNKQNRHIEELKNSLAIQKDEAAALRDYEYDARKRLYQEFEPILFQFIELSESAYYRILGLVTWCKNGRLKDIFSRNDYTMRRTLYDLFAPIAAFTILRNRLTLVDIELVPRIRFQYTVGKIIFQTFSDDMQFSEIEPPVPYPWVGNWKKYTREGLSIRSIENIATSFVIDNPGGSSRVMSLGEFDASIKSSAYEEKAVKRFLNFNPRCKPVLWRILLAQVHLYRALLNSNKEEYSKYFRKRLSDDECLTIDLFMSMSKIPPNELNWRENGVNYLESDDDPLKAVSSYLIAKFMRFLNFSE